MNLLKKSYFLNSIQRTRLSRSVHMLETNGFLSISDEIKHSDQPVVALESTIITHGLPYPVNLETAIEVENAVRDLNVRYISFIFILFITNIYLLRLYLQLLGF